MEIQESLFVRNVSSGESESLSQIVWQVGQILILEWWRKPLVYMKKNIFFYKIQKNANVFMDEEKNIKSI